MQSHRIGSMLRPAIALVLLAVISVGSLAAQTTPLQLDAEEGYFESPGLDVFVFNSYYNGVFGDEKFGAVELIHHDVRTATNGDVRLSSTPEQWDPVPAYQDRVIDTANGRIIASMAYPDYDFEYRIVVEPLDEGFSMRVELDEPVPAALEGRAGLNFEFIPSSYFGKTYLMDATTGIFPRHTVGRMQENLTNDLEPRPMATGSQLVLAPDDPMKRVTIDGNGSTLSLYDGRNAAQNGWYVVRSVLPAGETGTVVQWTVTPNRVAEWTRSPVITHSQVGYLPTQEKIAIIEVGANDDASSTATLYQVMPDGRRVERKSSAAEPWGRYLRYDYATFDFSDVSEPGLYVIEYDGATSDVFPIDENVYGPSVWSATLDTYMPVQMDHMHINDRYRVWHGAGHLDDALQAPVNHEHFDLYRSGPSTDTAFEPGEHIPGLNVGGWHDAGDYDIRTPSQQATVSDMVLAYETFGIDWDETTVEQANRYVDLRNPDGIPDAVQQIEHGTLQLLAQYRAVGHAINGIIVPTLEQYTHLGDALTMTDNLVYDASLDSLEVDGVRSGTPDDRWAFTNKSTPLDYGSVASLAAASRALRGYNDALAEEAFETAVRVWDEEQAREEPVIIEQRSAGTGGPLWMEELNATIELLVTTEGEQKYVDRLQALWSELDERRLPWIAPAATRAMPYMDDAYDQDVEEAVRSYAAGLDSLTSENPFGVPITRGTWAGSGTVMRFGVSNYMLHKAFPELIGPEHTLNSMHFILGRHPASSVSMVSGVGVRSKTIAYGPNRADYSFVPGGIVPGVVIIKPNFPEMKTDWPFFWYEGEYVIPMAPSYIFLAHAAAELAE